jgi:replicative DNA helicase
VLDAEILSAVIASREAYDRIRPHINAKDLTPAVAFWYDLADAWYRQDKTAGSIDVATIRGLGESRITNPKQRDTLMGVIAGLPASPSPSNVVAVALELKRWNIGMELAAAIAARDAKKTSKLHAEFGELLSASTLQAKETTEWEDAVPIEQIFEKVGTANRIPLAPSVLNKRINGGALPGHHVLVFARPEMGKSTFAVNAGVQLAIQGRKVLYAGNEDQINVLKARALSRATNMTLAQAEADKDRAFRIYRERGVEDNLIFKQLKHGSANALREQIELIEPSILIVDQIRNLESDDEGMVQRLETNGQVMRELLLEYGLIGISVTQAGDSATGKVWLGMHDLDNSKTGLPGTADLMIGIGASAEMLTRNQRALSLPKNKLSSDEFSHEGLIVEIDKSRSLYR